MTKVERLAAQILELPPEGRRKIQKLVNEIRRTPAPQRSSGRTRRRSFADAPIFGMWKDRAEMADSTAWVRSARKKEWGEPA
jgi:hypothetical protein